jgi:hypothetical protein
MNLKSTRWTSILQVVPIQFLLILGVLALWQYLPEVPWLRSRSVIFDPFFISSPSHWPPWHATDLAIRSSDHRGCPDRIGRGDGAWSSGRFGFQQ